MTIKKVFMYEAADGRCYTSRHDAELANARIEVRRILAQDGFYSDDDLDNAVDQVMRHGAGLYQALMPAFVCREVGDEE